MVIWLVRKQWLLTVVRVALFVMIPYLVFMAHVQLPLFVSSQLVFVSHLAFGCVAFLAVMTLKFTRRERGFKANPSDFLIILASFLITSIPEIRNAVEDISLITAKLIALFFAFEVLLGETRGEVNKLALFTMTCLGTLAVKSFI